MPKVSFLQCGQDVQITGLKLQGRILAVCIRDALVTYEVVWFVGDTRNCAWMQESEIQAPSGSRRMGL